MHGHSYTANPLGCAAGLASLDLLLAPECQTRMAAIETANRQRLADIAKLETVARPRLCGTIAAFDLTGAARGAGPRLKLALRQRGLLMRPMGDVLYLLPPYCLDDVALHHAWDIIADELSNLAGAEPCCASRKSSEPWTTSSVIP